MDPLAHGGNIHLDVRGIQSKAVQLLSQGLDTDIHRIRLRPVDIIIVFPCKGGIVDLHRINTFL